MVFVVRVGFVIEGSGLGAARQLRCESANGRLLQWVDVSGSGVAWCGVAKGSMDVLVVIMSVC